MKDAIQLGVMMLIIAGGMLILTMFLLERVEKNKQAQLLSCIESTGDKHFCYTVITNKFK